jgi:putative tryptophan/tyrosine transport system substrate-binding protein
MQEIGILDSASPDSRGDALSAFFGGLAAAGVNGGADVAVSYVWANNNYALLPALAKTLVDRKVAVIVAVGGTVSAIEVMKATAAIPIVFTAVTDPAKSGLVGKNLTGTAGITADLDPKRLELLHELTGAKLIGVLANSNRPNVGDRVADLQNAARKLKRELEVQKAATPSEIEVAFDVFAAKKIGALLVSADPFFSSQRAKIVGLAAQKKIPAMYQWREFVAAGGLMSFGPKIADAYRQAGNYAARILKGDKVANLPIKDLTEFELFVNKKAATDLHLKIPSNLLGISVIPI